MSYINFSNGSASKNNFSVLDNKKKEKETKESTKDTNKSTTSVNKDIKNEVSNLVNTFVSNNLNKTSTNTQQNVINANKNNIMLNNNGNQIIDKRLLNETDGKKLLSAVEAGIVDQRTFTNEQYRNYANAKLNKLNTTASDLVSKANFKDFLNDKFGNNNSLFNPYSPYKNDNFLTTVDATDYRQLNAKNQLEQNYTPNAFDKFLSGTVASGIDTLLEDANTIGTPIKNALGYYGNFITPLTELDKYNDGGIAYNLGSTTGQVLGQAGKAVLTQGATANPGYVAVSSGLSDLNRTALDKQKENGTGYFANYLMNIPKSAVNGAIESYLDGFSKAFRNKLRIPVNEQSAKWYKELLKSMLSEGSEEALQTLTDALNDALNPMYTFNYINENGEFDFWKLAKEVGVSSAYGAIGGALGEGLSYTANSSYFDKNREALAQKELANKTVNAQNEKTNGGTKLSKTINGQSNEEIGNALERLMQSNVSQPAQEVPNTTTALGKQEIKKTQKPKVQENIQENVQEPVQVELEQAKSTKTRSNANTTNVKTQGQEIIRNMLNEVGTDSYSKVKDLLGWIDDESGSVNYQKVIDDDASGKIDKVIELVSKNTSDEDIKTQLKEQKVELKSDEEIQAQIGKINNKETKPKKTTNKKETKLSNAVKEEVKEESKPIDIVNKALSNKKFANSLSQEDYDSAIENTLKERDEYKPLEEKDLTRMNKLESKGSKNGLNSDEMLELELLRTRKDLFNEEEQVEQQEEPTNEEAKQEEPKKKGQAPTKLGEANAYLNKRKKSQVSHKETTTAIRDKEGNVLRKEVKDDEGNVLYTKVVTEEKAKNVQNIAKDAQSKDDYLKKANRYALTKEERAERDKIREDISNNSNNRNTVREQIIDRLGEDALGIEENESNISDENQGRKGALKWDYKKESNILVLRVNELESRLRKRQGDLKKAKKQETIDSINDEIADIEYDLEQYKDAQVALNQERYEAIDDLLSAIDSTIRIQENSGIDTTESEAIREELISEHDSLKDEMNKETSYMTNTKWNRYNDLNNKVEYYIREKAQDEYEANEKVKAQEKALEKESQPTTQKNEQTKKEWEEEHKKRLDTLNERLNDLEDELKSIDEDYEKFKVEDYENEKDGIKSYGKNISFEGETTNSIQAMERKLQKLLEKDVRTYKEEEELYKLEKKLEEASNKLLNDNESMYTSMTQNRQSVLKEIEEVKKQISAEKKDKYSKEEPIPEIIKLGRESNNSSVAGSKGNRSSYSAMEKESFILNTIQGRKIKSDLELMNPDNLITKEQVKAIFIEKYFDTNEREETIQKVQTFTYTGKDGKEHTINYIPARALFGTKEEIDEALNEDFIKQYKLDKDKAIDILDSIREREEIANKFIKDNKEGYKVLNKLSKMFDCKVIIDSKLKKGDYGYIDKDGNIVVSSKIPKDYVKKFAFHEATHRMAQINPKKYNEYKKAVLDVLNSNESTKKKLDKAYLEAYDKVIERDKDGNINMDKVNDEMVANFSAVAFENSDVLNATARANKSAFMKFLDILKQTFKKITEKVSGRAYYNIKDDLSGVNIKVYEDELNNIYNKFNSLVYNSNLENVDYNDYTMKQNIKKTKLSDSIDSQIDRLNRLIKDSNEKTMIEANEKQDKEYTSSIGSLMKNKTLNKNIHKAYKEMAQEGNIGEEYESSMDMLISDELLEQSRKLYNSIRRRYNIYDNYAVANKFVEKIVEYADWGRTENGYTEFFGENQLKGEGNVSSNAREAFVDALLFKLENENNVSRPQIMTTLDAEIDNRISSLVGRDISANDNVKFDEVAKEGFILSKYANAIKLLIKEKYEGRKINDLSISELKSFADQSRNEILSHYRSTFEMLIPTKAKYQEAQDYLLDALNESINSIYSTYNSKNPNNKIQEIEKKGGKLYNDFYDNSYEKNDSLSADEIQAMHEEKIKLGEEILSQLVNQTKRINEEFKNVESNDDAYKLALMLSQNAKQYQNVKNRIERLQGKIEVQNSMKYLEEIKSTAEAGIAFIEDTLKEIDNEIKSLKGKKNQEKLTTLREQRKGFATMLEVLKGSTQLANVQFMKVSPKQNTRENTSYKNFVEGKNTLSNEELDTKIKENFDNNSTYKMRSHDETRNLAQQYIDKTGWHKSKDNILNGTVPIGIASAVAEKVNDYFVDKGDIEGLADMWDTIYKTAKETGRFNEYMKALYDRPEIRIRVVEKWVKQYNNGDDQVPTFIKEMAPVEETPTIEQTQQKSTTNNGTKLSNVNKTNKTIVDKVDTLNKEAQKIGRLVENATNDYNNGRKKNRIVWNGKVKQDLFNVFDRTSELRKTLKNDTRKEMNDSLKQIWVNSAKVNNKLEKKMLSSAISNANMENEFILKAIDDIAISNIFNQAKASFGKKVADYQTMSLLLNIKSPINNIISEVNSSFIEDGIVDKIGGTVGKAIVKLFDKKSNDADYSQIGNYLKRHHSKQEQKEALEFAKNEGLKETAQILSGIYNVQNLKYTTNADKSVNALTKTFKSKVGDSAQKALFITQGVSDTIISAYNEFREKQNAKATLSEDKIAELFEQEYPEYRGKFMVFNSPGKIADSMAKLKNLMNSGQKAVFDMFGIPTSGDFGIGDIMIKFTKVGSNIVTRATEFTPLGALKSIRLINQVNQLRMAGKPVTVKQIEACRSIGRNLTGSALIGLGMLLAQLGVITGKDDDDEKLQEYLGVSNNNAGYINLSRLGRKDGKVKEGDRLIATNGMSPYYDIIKIGAMASDLFEGKSTFGETLLDQAVTIVDLLPLSYQAESIYNTLKYDGVVGVGEKILLDNIAFLTPSIIKHVENARNTDYKNSYHNFGTSLLYSLGLKNTLPSYKSANGETRKYNTAGFLENFVANSLGITLRDVNAVKELDIYRDLEKDVKIPQSSIPVVKAPNKNEHKIGDKEANSVKLSLNDKTEYMEAYSKYYQENISKYMNDNYNKNMSVEDKEKFVKELTNLQGEAKKYAELYAMKFDDTKKVEDTFVYKAKAQDIDLFNRPKVSSEDMRKAGWNVKDGYSTVYSRTYYASDFGFRGSKAIVLTPIKSTGKVLTPKELDNYARKIFQGKDINLNICVGQFDTHEEANKYAMKLHTQQELLYD